MTTEQYPTEEYEESRNLWSKLKDSIRPSADADYEEADARPSRRKSIPLRMHSARPNRVSVWHAAETFDTARQVADGLREGHPQVVNLENTSPEMAGRIIDFLNGVIYALEGYVEKVGNKVFFFTPSNTVIDVEEASSKNRARYTGN